MKRTTFLIALAIFCVTSTTGQNSTDIQAKDKIILDLQNQVAKLEKEIEYYKKALNLQNSNVTAEDQGVEFKINSVNGNLNTGIIVIEGILINKGVIRSIQGREANAFDPQGNEIRTIAVSVGAGGRISELNREIDVKFRVEFKNSISEVHIFRNMTIKFYSSVDYKSSDISVTFRNVSIEWK